MPQNSLFFVKYFQASYNITFKGRYLLEANIISTKKLVAGMLSHLLQMTVIQTSHILNVGILVAHYKPETMTEVSLLSELAMFLSTWPS